MTISLKEFESGQYLNQLKADVTNGDPQKRKSGLTQITQNIIALRKCFEWFIKYVCNIENEDDQNIYRFTNLKKSSNSYGEMNDCEYSVEADVCIEKTTTTKKKIRRIAKENFSFAS